MPVPFRTTVSPRPSTTSPRRRLLGRSLAVVALAAVTAAIAAPASAATDPAAEAPTVTAPFEASDAAATAEATAAVDAAKSVAAKADGKVDTVDLDVQIAQLDDPQDLPQFVVAAFTDMLRATTEDVQKALAAYEKKKAAAAAALKKANTRSGAKATARAMMAEKYGWGDGQFSCLDSLWTKESGWSYKAYNRGSGATGIPQALPGSKMASAGSDWKTSARTQIKWGLAYIERAYGTPCAAWGHSQATNWY